MILEKKFKAVLIILSGFTIPLVLGHCAPIASSMDKSLLRAQMDGTGGGTENLPNSGPNGEGIPQGNLQISTTTMNLETHILDAEELTQDITPLPGSATPHQRLISLTAAQIKSLDENKKLVIDLGSDQPDSGSAYFNISSEEDLDLSDSDEQLFAVTLRALDNRHWVLSVSSDTPEDVGNAVLDNTESATIILSGLHVNAQQASSIQPLITPSPAPSTSPQPATSGS